MSRYKLLSEIDSPADLKKLKLNQLEYLCEEVREYIIEHTSINPGHLGSSLGVIELAVAIHYVFDTPNDKLVWDVGHQAYAHKILTGRRKEFTQNRKYKGISGFPRMTESPYDAFGVGHSSTSISSILGMAMGAVLSANTYRNHIAVIGDGSMTGGMAFEGLNHAGITQANMLVILNDNGMAIDENVGALNSYLTKLTTSVPYNSFRRKIWQMFSHKDERGYPIRNIIKQIQDVIKSSLLKNSNLFEALGFRYFGPINGHDIVSMVKVLRGLKHIRGAKVLHCVTVKGKGLHEAEISQTLYHAPGRFDKETGKILEIAFDPGKVEKYQKVFGETICELAQTNEKIIGITPAMASGCSLDIMMKKYPHRTFDVGIAEQHAVTFSAGMSTDGFIPFCNIYSTFLQRAYDQIIHDVALQNLHVIFCIDRAGLVGEDGSTHHGTYDLAFLRCIPNMIIAAPLNELDLRNMMFTATLTNAPFAIRYPRGEGVRNNWKNQPFEKYEIGKGICLKEGNDLAIISIGHIGNTALQVANTLTDEGIYNIAVYDIRFLKPIDNNLLHTVLSQHKIVVTLENGSAIGGLGSAVSEFITIHNYKNKLEIIGIPDRFIEQGTVEELQQECGLDYEHVLTTVKQLLSTSTMNYEL
ncbi:MAG: 1-deoxy-D-xylulose-5-phosphate synthase [Bacteroidales bacterium]|jgi:1-deoxy-D-xylulose-5-phosphate synthase|nr:1-deoxy-D-xylulose-5-phosphate synthase [Bacteroidales bacterium]